MKSNTTNMLVEFRFANFKSFKNMAEFSLLATNDHTNEDGSIAEVNGDRILRCTGIYGANGSGKTNFVNAFAYMRNLVSFYSQSKEEGDWSEDFTFRLDKSSSNDPMYFEVIFYSNNTRYRYGFEAKKDQIISEWLFVMSTSRETKLFTRDETGLHLGRSFKEGANIKLRSERLFLSVAAEFNEGGIAEQLVDWFGHTNISSGVHSGLSYTAHILKDHDVKDKQKILDILRRFDVQIEDILFRESTVEGQPAEIITVHNMYDTDKKNGQQEFSLEDESDGTTRLVGLAAYLIEALDHGHPLVIDEIEAKLHPLVTRKIIEVFNNPDLNDNNSQIIFTTHDTNLLNDHALRRDQIWFAEKDHHGSSHMYSLVEYKEKPRKDASLEKSYIRGRYGGIPFIGNIDEILGY